MLGEKEPVGSDQSGQTPPSVRRLGEVRFTQVNGRVTGFDIVLPDTVEIHDRHNNSSLGVVTELNGTRRVVLREIKPLGSAEAPK